MKYENIIFYALTDEASRGWNEYAMANAALEAVDATVDNYTFERIRRCINWNLMPTTNFTKMAKHVTELILTNNLEVKSVFSKGGNDETAPRIEQQEPAIHA